jgi:hypothetical protein
VKRRWREVESGEKREERREKKRRREDTRHGVAGHPRHPSH